jgi:phage terminase large subunit GpA-like protein
MNAFRAAEFMKQYAKCPKCDSEFIGNGEGSIEVTEQHFHRRCKCGFDILIVEPEVKPHA